MWRAYNMDNIKLINEYKKLNLSKKNKNSGFIVFTIYMSAFVFFVILAFFLFKFIPSNPLTFSLYIIVSILLSDIIFKPLSLLQYKLDKKTYIEMKLQYEKYKDDLSLIFSEKDMIDIVEGCGGIDRLKTSLALNNGVLPCSTILDIIRNAQHYRRKINNKIEMSKTTEIEGVLKQELTPMGKQLAFLDKI